MELSPDPTILEILRSPRTGRRLRYAEPSILDDGQTLWPIVDGIPFLRTGRDELRREAVRALLRRDMRSALLVLLTDRKDESIPAAEPAGLRRALAANSARQAMTNLGYGSLADYFIHRGSHPSFLSGLALLEAHAAAGETLFELACGVGHFLRFWSLAGGAAIGADAVFSHLWLAKRFVAPGARFVCFDANDRFPLATGCATFSFANDAFHYMSRKTSAFNEMCRISATGRVLLGHVHNAEQRNFSAGLPLSVEDYRSIVCPRLSYDDAELTRAALTGRVARPAPATALRSAQAVAFVVGESHLAERASLVVPPVGSELWVNPILTDAGPVWPNRRFEEEYVRYWSYLSAMRCPPQDIIDLAVEGGVGCDPRLESHCRMRTLVHLPENWL